MKYSTRFGKIVLLSVFTLLLLLALSPSVVLAGEMPFESSVESGEAPAEAASGERMETPTEAASGEQMQTPAEAVSGEQVQAPVETAERLYRSTSGFTIGISGGVSVLNDTDFSAPAVEFEGYQYGPLEGTASYGQGYGLNFMLGYAFENGLRIGAEIGYIGNNCYEEMNVTMPGTLLTQVGLDSVGNPCLADAAGCTPYKALPKSSQDALSQNSVGTSKVRGKLRALTFMLSAYYDLDLGSDLVPYVGAGLGGADLSTEVKSNEGVTKGKLLLDDSDYVLAYQVSAGLGYKISDILGLSNDLMVTFDYRYLASMQDADLQGSLTGHSLESEFGGHYIGGGIRLGL